MYRVDTTTAMVHVPDSRLRCQSFCPLHPRHVMPRLRLDDWRPSACAQRAANLEKAARTAPGPRRGFAHSLNRLLHPAAFPFPGGREALPSAEAVAEVRRSWRLRCIICGVSRLNFVSPLPQSRGSALDRLKMFINLGRRQRARRQHASTVSFERRDTNRSSNSARIYVDDMLHGPGSQKDAFAYCRPPIRAKHVSDKVSKRIS